MTITFFWNYLNHHQVLVADELFKLLRENFKFVATLPLNVNELKGGEDYSNRPYCLIALESDEAKVNALALARNSDVCVFGACSQDYALERAKQPDCGLAFECGERWLKKGWMNVLSPVLRTWWRNYRKYYKKAPFYKLCSSAFAAKDDEKLGCYRGKHFKWAYFADGSLTIDRPIITSQSIVRLMWCARFIDWKHPEMAIECAKKLKADGYYFKLNMFGEGPLKERMQQLVADYGLSNEVHFNGNVPNEQVNEAMRQSDIFLFTSDKQEGWGVVANEAMSNGCCLVGSDEIGAVPYLVEEGKTGLVFKSKNVDSLYEKVKLLMDNPQRRIQIAESGRKNMLECWNARHAAESFLQLVDDLCNGRDTSIKEGPCSKA